MHLNWHDKKTCICLVLFLSSFKSMAAEQGPNQARAEYHAFIEAEKVSNNPRHSVELAVSGLAGLTIGLYGYYISEAGPVTKLLYAATQTAGIITFGEALRQYYSPNLYLSLDSYMNSAASTDEGSGKFQQLILDYRRGVKVANLKSVAYTSSILAVLYFYNGYRESKEEHTVQNIYYFLGFNTALISAVSAYQLYTFSGEAAAAATSELRAIPNGIEWVMHW